MSLSYRSLIMAIALLVVPTQYVPSRFVAQADEPQVAPNSNTVLGALTDIDTEEAATDTEGENALSEDPTEENADEGEHAELRNKVRDCLAAYYRRHERVADHSPWGIMHSLIAFGVDTQVIARGQKVNAIGWLCWNQPCLGMRLFYTSNGTLQCRMGPGVQGHAGQFLAMLAQSRVPIEYQIKAGGREFTVADLVELEKQTCRAGTELTFKLIGLSHYLKSDEEWKNNIGEKWSVSRLIKEELRQSVIGSACGGTHRMMGFSYAVRKRRQRKEPIDGQWKRAAKFVQDYHEYTLKLQNPDGSFSTSWFEGRGANPNIDRRLQTTGHILEWIVYSLDEDELKDERIIKAVDYLSDLMLKHRSRKWEIGPLGHAVHGLAIYDERVFGGKLGQRAEQLARHRAKRAKQKATLAKKPGETVPSSPRSQNR